ncbi:MAG: tyrosinase family protein [Chloroflexi bacterium]|nr:tyrosinase family protein [Chloroflexota bacterium]
MTATRRNIAENSNDRDAYVQGVTLLKQESAGLSTADLGISPRPGFVAQQISTWDLFLIWHIAAMNEATPPNSGRNAAHRGPSFLPWHRWLLILLEAHLQRVLGDPDFGLPYWDWAADGELPAGQQAGQAVWSAACMGGNGRPNDREVTTGPFRRTSAFQIRLETDSDGRMWATDRALRRNFGAGFESLPRKADVTRALDQTSYDAAPWGSTATGFRNHLEGFVPPPASLNDPPSNVHNLVHIWIGGDMGPASSPNDPVFFLNHCNVDRIWAAWQSQNPGRPYRPPASAPASLFRHRRNDPLNSILTQMQPSPADVLNVSNIYVYDSLIVD